MKKENIYITVKISACLIICILCFTFIINYFEQIERGRLESQIFSLGLPVLIIFIPYIIIIFSDTLGWYNCFGKNMPQIPIRKLFLIRLATETIQTSLPGGAAYAEIVRPYLLKKHMNLEYTESISANIIAKVNILLAQVIFLFFGFLIVIIKFKENITSSQFLMGSFVYPAAVIFTLVIFLFSFLLYKKNLLVRLILLLEKIKLKTVKRMLSKIRKPSIEINNTLSAFYKEHKGRLYLTTAIFFFTWIMMAFESLIILKVMGIDANIFQMIMLESLISIVRIAFFFLPGAAGPQDASIIMLFILAGLPDPLLNSFIFVILKRSKELIWITAGYILLAYYGIEIKKLFGAKRKELEFIPESVKKF